MFVLRPRLDGNLLKHPPHGAQVSQVTLLCPTRDLIQEAHRGRLKTRLGRIIRRVDNFDVNFHSVVAALDPAQGEDLVPQAIVARRPAIGDVGERTPRAAANIQPVAGLSPCRPPRPATATQGQMLVMAGSSWRARIGSQGHSIQWAAPPGVTRPS